MFAPVFNLTVEPQHVYFASGVLVSNCDAMRYACGYGWRKGGESEKAQEESLDPVSRDAIDFLKQEREREQKTLAVIRYQAQARALARNYRSN